MSDLILPSRGDHQLPARAHPGQARQGGQGCQRLGLTHALWATTPPVKKNILRWVQPPLIATLSWFIFIFNQQIKVTNSYRHCYFNIWNFCTGPWFPSPYLIFLLKVCRTDLGVSSCYCKPGYGRKSHRGMCKSEISSFLLIFCTFLCPSPFWNFKLLPFCWCSIKLCSPQRRSGCWCQWKLTESKITG